MMQNNLKVAITGGIGSGKSCVAEIIRDNGYSVFSCDAIYAELLKDKSFSNKLVNNFGEILTESGEIDKKKLSEIVFSDSTKLKLLNELTHSSIITEALRRSEGLKLSFCEVPLLFENGYEKYFDDVIVIFRDEEERISAVIKRSNISREEAKKRIKSQFDYINNDFTKYYVIHNNGDLANLKTKTKNILKKIENKLS